MTARKKLLATAANLIHTKGFNNTSVQDILDGSSVCRSNFYYHFDTKEQLGFEVFARRMRWWYGYVIKPSLDNEELSPSEQVNVLLDKICAIGESSSGEMGCPFGNLAQEMSPIHEGFREALSEFFENIVHRLEQCLDAGKACGEFRDDLESRRHAEFAIAQIQGSFLLRKTHKDPGVMRRNIEMLREMIQVHLRTTVRNQS
jgi:TetR/AcrR family transcriptional repressor of nem operon